MSKLYLVPTPIGNLVELGRVQVFVEEPVFVRLLPDGLVVGVDPAGVRVVPEGRASL